MKDFDFPSAESKGLSAKNKKFDQDILKEMTYPYLKGCKTAFDDMITL